MMTPRYFYPLSDRSPDYWALSLSFVDVLKINFQLKEDTVRVAFDDLVEFLFRKLTYYFGAEYGVFYKDLANRSPEVVFDFNPQVWRNNKLFELGSVASTNPLEYWESK